MKAIQTLSIPIRELPNGDQLGLKTYEIEGDAPGPEVHIQSSIHGAEIQGNAVIYKLIEFLQERSFSGRVRFIPMANPWGLTQKSGTFTQGRFNPMTGDNWNRNFVDLLKLDEKVSGFTLKDFVECHKEADDEAVISAFKKSLVAMIDHYVEHLSKRGLSDNKKLNLILQKLAAPADIVLDLHTGFYSTRYLYTSELLMESSKHFGIPFTLIYPNAFAGAMDESTQAPWWGLVNAFREAGRTLSMPFESFTVELGSQECISLEDAEVDSARILNYLNHKGMQIQNLPPLEKTEMHACYLRDYKRYSAPRGGLYQYLVAPGEKFKEGQVLARILNLHEIENSSLKKCLSEVHAVADGILLNHPQTGVLGEGSELIQVMENTFSHDKSHLTH